jgi:hypothetical protein
METKTTLYCIQQCPTIALKIFEFSVFHCLIPFIYAWRQPYRPRQYHCVALLNTTVLDGNTNYHCHVFEHAYMNRCQMSVHTRRDVPPLTAQNPGSIRGQAIYDLFLMTALGQVVLRILRFSPDINYHSTKVPY